MAESGSSVPSPSTSPLQSSPSVGSTKGNLISRLSLATLSDKEKLRVFLTGLKVSDLRQEFKIRNVAYSGLTTKALLINGLLDVLLTQKRKQASPTVDTPCGSDPTQHPASPVASNQDTSCVCGVVVNDGSPMLQCVDCNKWSHLACYGISKSAAKKAKFKCRECTKSSSTDHIFSSLSQQVNDLFHKVNTLSSQLSSHIKVCNSNYIKSCNESMKVSIEKLQVSIGRIQDNMNCLNMEVSSGYNYPETTYLNHPQDGQFGPTRAQNKSYVSSSKRSYGSRNLSTHSPNPSTSKIKTNTYSETAADEDWGSSFSPLCTGSIIDPSGTTDRHAIGHLIKGLFDWDYPRFEVEELPPSSHSSQKVYHLPIASPSTL